MQTIVLLLIASLAAIAQPNLSLSGPAAPVTPGSTVTVTITLAGNDAEAKLSGVGFSLLGVPAGAAVVSLLPDKVATCGGLPVKCMLVGSSPPMNANALPNGPIASVTFPLGGAISISFDTAYPSWTGVTEGGARAAILSGAALAITPLSSCDVNADGQTDAADVAALLASYLAAVAGGPPCTRDLDGNGVACDVVDVQRVIAATLPGGVCKTGQ